MSPYCPAACSYIPRTLSASATSTFTAKASRASEAVFSAAFLSTSATHTWAPSSQKSSAASRPIPPPAPVMTATFPSSRPISGRQEHVFDLRVPVQRMHPELAAEPGLLEAAERCRRAHRRVRVDRQRARFEGSGNAHCTGSVLRPDRAREPVRRVVGDQDRLFLVGE